MVKRARLQSQLAPIFFCCSTMRSPYLFFQSHTRSRNLSRPRSYRVSPSFTRRFSSTLIWVAMPAWSVPGTHRAA